MEHIHSTEMLIDNDVIGCYVVAFAIATVEVIRSCCVLYPVTELMYRTSIVVLVLLDGIENVMNWK